VIIDNKTYLLKSGALFLVSTRGGATKVLQLKRDLSVLRPEEASFVRLVKEDAEVARFVREAAQPEGGP